MIPFELLLSRVFRKADARGIEMIKLRMICLTVLLFVLVLGFHPVQSLDSHPAGATGISATSAPAGFVLLDTVTVPSTGAIVTSSVSLTAGVVYRLRASGTITVGGPGFGDAEYAFDSLNGSVQNNCGAPFPAVDIGIGVNDSANSTNKFPFWGSFDATHVYTANVVGQGAPISLNYHDCLYDDNSGTLTVEIFAPTMFDICLQDDLTGNLLLFNSSTGDYQFSNCRKGLTITGTGVVAANGCKVQLSDTGPDPKRPDRNVSALANTCTRAGSASVQLLAIMKTFNISDSNMSNNVCACP
jgi:hypothetical protein